MVWNYDFLLILCILSLLYVQELSADGGAGALEVVGPLWCIVCVSSQCDRCCAGCVVVWPCTCVWGGFFGYSYPSRWMLASKPQFKRFIDDDETFDLHWIAVIFDIIVTFTQCVVF